MILKRHHFLSLAFSLLVLFSFGQTSTYATRNFVKKNALLLRWAPPDKNMFDTGVKYGYTIERIQLSSVFTPDTSDFRVATKINDTPLKPRTANDTTYWRKLISQNKNAGLLYGVTYPQLPKKYIDPVQKQKSDLMSYGLMLMSCDFSAEISSAAGLFIADSTINNNTVYAYRIRLTKIPESNLFKPIIIVVDARKQTIISRVDSLKGKFQNKKVQLRWNVGNNKVDYAGYIIERSPDSISFSPVNKTPIVLALTDYEKEINYIDYADTVPELNQFYFYRIRGLTHFGEYGPVGNVVKIKAKVVIDGFPIIDSAKAINNKNGAIYWHLQKSADMKTVKGFAIARASKADGEYVFLNTTLLPANSTHFIDEQTQNINYYKVFAVSTGNDSVYSFPSMVQLEDRDPPQIPTALTGNIDAGGVVHLTWNSNHEKDLRGYRIFKSNSFSEELVEATKTILPDSCFSEMINIHTLEKNIYYSVVALDHVYNNSIYSPRLKLRRPDNIVPVSAIIKSCSFDAKGIHLQWINSSSDDVSKYLLRRTEENNLQTTLLKEWKPAMSDTVYLDTTAIEGQHYVYTITTIDSSENISIVVSHLIYFEPGIRKKISTISAIANRPDRKINLKWNYEKKGISNYILYRAKKSEPLRILKTLGSDDNLFSDTSVYANNVYVYAIKAVFISGAESELSDLIEVTY